MNKHSIKSINTGRVRRALGDGERALSDLQEAQRIRSWTRTLENAAGAALLALLVALAGAFAGPEAPDAFGQAVGQAAVAPPPVGSIDALTSVPGLYP